MGIVLAILLMSLLAAAGIFLLVISCALPQLQTPKGACWVLFVLFFYVLVPLPVIFMKRVSKIFHLLSRDKEFNAWAMQNKSALLRVSLISDFVLFFTCGIVLSAFALPIILARASIIKWAAVGIIAVANFFIFGTMLAFFRRCDEHDKDGENQIKYDFKSYRNADDALMSMLKNQVNT